MQDYEKIMQEEIKVDILERSSKRTNLKMSFTTYFINPLSEKKLSRPRWELLTTVQQNQMHKYHYWTTAWSLAHHSHLNLWYPFEKSHEKYCILANIKKDFLEIKLDEKDRDRQRALWWNLRWFTSVLFGAGRSSYILAATLYDHLSKHKDKFLETCR